MAGILLLIVLDGVLRTPLERHFPLVSEHPRRARTAARGRGGDDRLRHADDLRRIRSLGRLGFRAHADEHRAHAQRWRSVLAGVRRRGLDLRRHRLSQRFHHAEVRYSELHHDARHALHGALADRRDFRRISALAGGRQDPDGAVHRTSSAAASSGLRSSGSWRSSCSPRRSWR